MAMAFLGPLLRRQHQRGWGCHEVMVVLGSGRCLHRSGHSRRMATAFSGRLRRRQCRKSRLEACPKSSQIGRCCRQRGRHQAIVVIGQFLRCQCLGPDCGGCLVVVSFIRHLCLHLRLVATAFVGCRPHAHSRHPRSVGVRGWPCITGAVKSGKRARCGGGGDGAIEKLFARRIALFVGRRCRQAPDRA
jgi:hypothetical protein